MVNLLQFKVLFLVVTAGSALLVASPALQRFLVYPQTEFFTELSLLSAQHKAEGYPFNVTSGANYDLYLDISNSLGYVSDYLLEVKFRNTTQSAPGDFNRTPSSLPSLYNMSVFVADKESWETPLTFSFDYKYDENLSQVTFNRMVLNNLSLNLTGFSAMRDAQRQGMYGVLFFELWVYDSSLSAFKYHERFVSLYLNITVSASTPIM